jgi:hypothetical protein
MSEQHNDDEEDDEATFFEVIFGEEGGEQERFSFEEFRDLTLRKRVRLLMSMPSRFLSAEGDEIPRDAAMRFRQRAPRLSEQGGSAPAAPASSSASAATPVFASAAKERPPAAPAPRGPQSHVEARIAKLIRQLQESTLEHELRGCIKMAETIDVMHADQREPLANGLLRTAKLLEEEIGSTPLSWAAIRRFGSLVPTERLGELAPFLAPGTEGETIQATAQTLWNTLSVDQDFGLGVLAARTRQLLTKYLDPDWLCCAFTRALATDLLLANSVLTPSADEAGLRSIYSRVRSLADAIPLELARAEIDEALAYAREHQRPIAARLELLAELTKGSS